VVIAIVSDAWEDARDHATDLYWRGRINFLSETSVVNQAPRKWQLLRVINRILKPLFTHIDNMKFMSLEEPKFDWSKDYPFCLVNNKRAYDNPFHYLQIAEAREIKNARSYKSDLHWLNDAINDHRLRSDTASSAKDKNDEVENISIMTIQWLTACLWCKWFLWTGWYIIYLVIGLPCLGLWWPQPFRKFLLSFGNLSEDNENEDETKKDSDSMLVREEINKLAYRIEALEGTNEGTENGKKKSEKESAEKGVSIMGQASFRRSVLSRSILSRSGKVYN